MYEPHSPEPATRYLWSQVWLHPSSRGGFSHSCLTPNPWRHGLLCTLFLCLNGFKRSLVNLIRERGQTRKTDPVEENSQEGNAKRCFKCQKRSSSDLYLYILSFDLSSGPETNYSSIDEKMDVHQDSHSRPVSLRLCLAASHPGLSFSPSSCTCDCISSVYSGGENSAVSPFSQWSPLRPRVSWKEKELKKPPGGHSREKKELETLPVMTPIFLKNKFPL